MPVVSDVSASSRPDDPDRWGEESKELAQAKDPSVEDDEPGSEMGEHSSDPGVDTTPDREGRSGIGGLGLGHPSEVAEALCDDPNIGEDNCPDDAVD